MGTKVMKYPLIYVGGCGDYRNANKELWNLQRKTREILNRTIQILYTWTHSNPKQVRRVQEMKPTEGKDSDTYVIHEISWQYPEFYSGNFSATVRKARDKYKDLQNKIAKGEVSLPSYKADQPIIIRKQGIRIFKENEDILFSCPVFSDKYNKQNGYNRIVFATSRKLDNTQSTILSRVLDGTYRYGDCQLIYDRIWYLFLTYTIPRQDDEPSEKKTLGVDLGVVNAIYASSYGEHERLSIPGDEVIAKARQIEARTHAMQKQARHCGEGRIGHGTKARVAPVFDARERLSNYRDTINHRYSKKLVDFAVKNGYNVIQMEDLSGIKNPSPEKGYEINRLLRHWTYYDLQQKIEYKAKEVGINVIEINPQYTSQRCSKCGYISAENRPSQSEFKCCKCGFKVNADYNASQNLSIPGIDKIIQKWIKENGANEEPADSGR